MTQVFTAKSARVHFRDASLSDLMAGRILDVLRSQAQHDNDWARHAAMFGEQLALAMSAAKKQRKQPR